MSSVKLNNCRSASIDGKETNFKEVAQGLALAQKLIAQALEERDKAKGKKNKT
ncbi:MAG TPA: hypothetical protein VED00_03410 [archaeon]|nr:hypothetical protein [archaeon]